MIFQKEFVAAGTGLFGSGWVWLAKDKDGKLSITKEANGSNPVAHGLKPILGFDVWEHAYYLDYRNRRPDHLNALWKIIERSPSRVDRFGEGAGRSATAIGGELGEVQIMIKRLSGIVKDSTVGFCHDLF